MMSNDETPKPAPGRSVVNVSVSMEPPLVRQGRKLARARRQSFSAYVAGLVERDLAKASSRAALASISQPQTTEQAA